MEIFSIANDKNILPKYRVERMKSCLLHKGFGDKEQELFFISEFFKHVFKKHSALISIEWSQYQDYNDEYLHFDLESYRVNEKYDMDVFGFDWWNDDQNWEYRFEDETIWDSFTKDKKMHDKSEWEEWDKVYQELQEQLKPVKLATDCILSFLKVLYDYYKPYYFIYVFGRRARVKVTKDGIEISNIDVNYINGDSYDSEFKIE